jgi:hypothetical protein
MKTNTEQKVIIERLYRSLSNGIRNGKSIVPQNWLKERGLSAEATGACFNSGQVHHRKPDAFRDELVSVGFMSVSDKPTNTGQHGYTVFGHYGILFPLKDENGAVVNFYAIGIKNGRTAYMNEEGVYPCYPQVNTKKLFIVSSIIEAATLIEAKTLDNREAVLCIPDGKVLPQHKAAIKAITQLEEIILIETK